MVLGTWSAKRHLGMLRRRHLGTFWVPSRATRTIHPHHFAFSPQDHQLRVWATTPSTSSSQDHYNHQHRQYQHHHRHEETCFRALLLMFAIKKSNYFLQPGSSQSPKIDHLSSPKSPQNNNKLNINNSKNNNNNITMFPSSPFLQGPPGPQSLSGNISRIPLRIYPLMLMSD